MGLELPPQDPQSEHRAQMRDGPLNDLCELPAQDSVHGSSGEARKSKWTNMCIVGVSLNFRNVVSSALRPRPDCELFALTMFWK